MRIAVVHIEADRHRLEHPGHPADVVRVRMGRDQQVDSGDAHFPEKGDDVSPARVDQRGLALRRLQEHRVALADVEEGDAQGGVRGLGWGGLGRGRCGGKGREGEEGDGEDGRRRKCAPGTGVAGQLLAGRVNSSLGHADKRMRWRLVGPPRSGNRTRVRS